MGHVLASVLGFAPYALVAVAVLILRHFMVRETNTTWTLERHTDSRRLVVLVHGLSGIRGFGSAIDLAHQAFPGADLLVFRYKSNPFSNADPYGIANVIELQIHEAHKKGDYEEIILVGHSMGGMILRKSLIWGNGLEEDRHGFGAKGKRSWSDRATRFVSLATINRGWSIHERTRNMSRGRFWGLKIAALLAKVTGSGRLLFALQRGAPFVADSRVQWIDLCRGEHASARVPQTIHFVGDRDDVVSLEDSRDLIAAKDTVFITLAQTGHYEIAASLSGGKSAADEARREKVRLGLLGRIEQLSPDVLPELDEDPGIERIVYIAHGIRDYGEWTDQLRLRIEEEGAARNINVAVENLKYGHFPMLPFLIFKDRQKNVRFFMDEYTENKARYPQADEVDYVGHSNGTYILASALQRYRTLRVERVYFAGSVVPKHYPWRSIADQNRIRHLANVVAAGDWVVAIFPRIFEQIAEWRNLKPVMGALDIGSAGFRGFDHSMDIDKHIENFQFAKGSHSIGVNVDDKAKLDAIARYIISGETEGLAVFKGLNRPLGWLSHLSNLSWLVWLFLILALMSGGWLASSISPWAVSVYLLILVGLLRSV